MLGDSIRARNHQRPAIHVVLAAIGWLLVAVLLGLYAQEHGRYVRLNENVAVYHRQVEAQINLALAEAQQVRVALDECQTRTRKGSLGQWVLSSLLSTAHGVPLPGGLE